MYRYLIRSARPPATRQRLGKKTSRELEEVKIDNQALKLEKEITTHNFNRFRTSYKDYLSLREANQKYTNELANLSTKLTNVDRKINLMEELSTEEVSLIKERDKLRSLLADNEKAKDDVMWDGVQEGQLYVIAVRANAQYAGWTNYGEEAQVMVWKYFDPVVEL